MAEPTNPDNVQLNNPDNVHQPPTTSEPTECEPNLSCIVFQPQLTPYTDLLSSDESVPSTTTPLKGKRGKKRRKRFTDAIRKKQVREAASKYAKNNPDVNRLAAKKYSQSHPEVNKDVVKKIPQYSSGDKYESCLQI